MKKLAIVLISLAGFALSSGPVLAEDTAPAKTKTTKKKPSAKKSKTAKAAAVGTAVAAAPVVDAVAAQALATKYACLTCHKTDATKLIGPGFKEVAAKYKGDASAEAKLIDKVKLGGAGAWGSIPMPPHPQVPDADIKTLAQWVLSIK